jgi:hypothetical protein
VVATAVTGAGLVLAAGSLLPGRLGERPIANPFALAGPAGTVARVLFDAGVVLHAASAVAAVVSLVLRFRASRGVERQQLRWVAAGAAGAVAGLLPNILVGLGIAPRVNAVVVYPAVLCVPVTVAVAVLRYRLWDLDRLVSRTVTYTLVSGLLVLPYLLILPAATRLAAGSGSLAVAALTLAAAALFSPLRRRVQGGVDRRFNRRRYDAARTIEAFAIRLRERSTWTPSPASCSPWSSRRCSRPARRCGCARQPTRGHRGSRRHRQAPDDARVNPTPKNLKERRSPTRSCAACKAALGFPQLGDGGLCVLTV